MPEKEKAEVWWDEQIAYSTKLHHRLYLKTLGMDKADFNKDVYAHKSFKYLKPKTQKAIRDLYDIYAGTGK